MINLIGQKFNRLSVVEFVGRNSKGVSLWKCRCECGGSRITTSSELRSFRAKGCGCIQRTFKRKTKHGETNKSKEYCSWVHMKRRCNNPNDKHFISYGGRGIKVCERWANSYNEFLKDLGRAPSKDHSLDRIDVNGNYEPGNCRWATSKEQARNKRNSVLITLNGVTKNIKDWCVHFGLSTSTVSYRLKQGYSTDKLFKNAKT